MLDIYKLFNAADPKFFYITHFFIQKFLSIKACQFQDRYHQERIISAKFFPVVVKLYHLVEGILDDCFTARLSVFIKLKKSLNECQ